MSAASNPRIALVVAVAMNGVIGDAGTLPWRLSSDLKMFRRLTMGKPVIMGRRTFQSLPKPLDGRLNIVITRDPAFRPAGALVVLGVEAALAAARENAAATGADEIMVIGGADVYSQILPRADRIYWTEVHAMPDGDTRFPAFERTCWIETDREAIPRGPRDDFDAELVTLERAGGRGGL